MASGGENAADRGMKAMSWKVVDVVVFAIGGDARDVASSGGTGVRFLMRI